MDSIVRFTVDKVLNKPYESIPDALYMATGIVAATIVISKLFKRSELDNIPTVGSWWAVYDYRTDVTQLIQQGYEKYKHAPFKIAEFTRWIIVLGNPAHLEEIRKAPDDVLSLASASNYDLQTEYTMGPEFVHNHYHIDVVRSQVTRNIGHCYADIRDEIVTSFDEVLGLKGNEWKSVPTFKVAEQIVARVSNRLFVGLPLCRNPDWIDLNLKYTFNIIVTARIIQSFPKFLAPLVAFFMLNVSGTTKRATKLLGPIIEERLKRLEENGEDWPDKPNDFLTWLLDEADGSERSVELLTSRVVATNFSALLTTSHSFCHVLFHLAANPEYIQPLREEVESIVEKEGWTKASLAKMRKVDSFVRENERMKGLSSLSLMRRALVDYTFSDGTFIPKGAFVAAPSRALQLDEDIYEDGTAFNPFRFSSLREKDGEGLKYQLVSPSIDYLAFGFGKHACPGRFFAANELKSMLAHIVTTYDVKLEENAPLPQSVYIGRGCMADPKAKVMFRKRVY